MRTSRAALQLALRPAEAELEAEIDMAVAPLQAGASGLTHEHAPLGVCPRVTSRRPVRRVGSVGLHTHANGETVQTKFPEADNRSCLQRRTVQAASAATAAELEGGLPEFIVDEFEA